MFDNESDLLTVADLMELLYIGENKAYSLLNKGDIKGFRIGRSWRIPLDSVRKYIQEHTIQNQ